MKILVRVRVCVHVYVCVVWCVVCVYLQDHLLLGSSWLHSDLIKHSRENEQTIASHHCYKQLVFYLQNIKYSQQGMSAMCGCECEYKYDCQKYPEMIQEFLYG